MIRSEVWLDLAPWLIVYLLVALWLWRTPAASAAEPTWLKALRWVGVMAIVVDVRSMLAVAPLLDPRVLLLIGLPFILVLWLTASGFFGFGAPRRSDWIALIPFAAALVLVEGFTLHSIEEIELHFFSGRVPDKNSLLHPLFEMFVSQFATDSQRFTTHVQGIVNSLATLPLFLFARQRTGDRWAAFAVASFFALQPLVLRFGPTDGPYALIFLTWFCGLALLSTPEPGARPLFGGALLLGIAATCRMEGPLYLVASALLLDSRALRRAARRESVAAAAAGAGVAALIGVHWWYCLAPYVPSASPGALPIEYPNWHSFNHSLLGAVMHDGLWRALLLAGALAGGLDRRLRIGLGAALGALILSLPMSSSGNTGAITLHRFVPACGLEAVAVGIGAFSLARLLATRWPTQWWRVAPAAVALVVLAGHFSELRERHAYNEEYDILRQHFAPDGVPASDCVLLSFDGGNTDSGLHNVEQVLPNMEIVRCWSADCAAAARRGCAYYFREASCYVRRQDAPDECRNDGTRGGDVLPCLDERCAALEQALHLAPVDVRTVDVRAWSFGSDRLPQRANIGLFRVVETRP